MNAKEIMTTPVVTVGPRTLVGEAASLLFEKRISGLPVVEEGRLVGIVSEGDLLHRYEIGTDAYVPDRESWWARLFDDEDSAHDYVKSHARHVRDIMTRDVATASPETSLAEIAALLERRRIKRVPIVRAGRLVGIVSRSDLVRAFVAVKASRMELAPATDQAIRERLLRELRRHAWWRAEFANVTVEQGVVTYSGVLLDDVERIAARVAAETVGGVRRVVDRRLLYRDLPSIT